MSEKIDIEKSYQKILGLDEMSAEPEDQREQLEIALKRTWRVLCQEARSNAYSFLGVGAQEKERERWMLLWLRAAVSDNPAARHAIEEAGDSALELESMFGGKVS